MGITTGGRYTGFSVFIPRLPPPVLYALLPKLASRLLSLEEGTLVFKFLFLDFRLQFCMRVCNANSVAILEELRTLRKTG